MYHNAICMNHMYYMLFLARPRTSVPAPAFPYSAVSEGLSPGGI